MFLFAAAGRLAVFIVRRPFFLFDDDNDDDSSARRRRNEGVWVPLIKLAVFGARRRYWLRVFAVR